MKKRELAILGITMQHEKIGGKLNMGWSNKDKTVALSICGNKESLIKYLTKDTENFPIKELYRIGRLLQTGNYIKSYDYGDMSRIEKWTQLP